MDHAGREVSLLDMEKPLVEGEVNLLPSTATFSNPFLSINPPSSKLHPQRIFSSDSLSPADSSCSHQQHQPNKAPPGPLDPISALRCARLGAFDQGYVTSMLIKCSGLALGTRVHADCLGSPPAECGLNRGRRLDAGEHCTHGSLKMDAMLRTTSGRGSQLIRPTIIVTG